MALWNIVLWAAAGFNLLIGAGAMLQKGASREGRMVGLLVLAFGVVYAFVALEPARHLPMLWAGVLGKAGAIAIMLPAVARGEAPKALGWILAGDALFVGFFLMMLLRMA
ncbi:hypothetical protein A6F68_02763 [Tsuneonella dongtanensis]|uniref:Uncharacterized protein n=1 Tax=Tsuneonella dongtanensis TaxID=692370 RepID=A0A1B2AGH0_9SPHN|nr:hypothetical protein [Tsuneonella dongtanensis]ANY21253.1 hypothetical protein A6F68_02763 [Tsuneonella dongtanensis]